MTTPSERVASSGTVGSAQNTVSEKTDEIKGRAGAVTQDAKERATEVAQEARRQAKGLIDDRRDLVADKFMAIARALETTADQLDEEDEVTLAEYTDKAAMQLERLSRTIRERDAARLMGDVQGYARRNPLGFLAGAVAVGVMASRFFKASATDDFDDDLDDLEDDFDELDAADDDSRDAVSEVPQSRRETVVYGANQDALGASGMRGPSVPSPTTATPAAAVPSSPYSPERSNDYGDRKLP